MTAHPSSTFMAFTPLFQGKRHGTVPSGVAMAVVRIGRKQVYRPLRYGRFRGLIARRQWSSMKAESG